MPRRCAPRRSAITGPPPAGKPAAPARVVGASALALGTAALALLAAAAGVSPATGAAAGPGAAPAAEARPAPATDGGRTIVVCAPGYPGSTLEAQPTMDAFAAATAASAGLQPGAIGAVYHETLEGCLDRLGAGDAALALVTLPLHLQEGARLRLAPRLQAAIEPDGRETWSLVARKGALAGAADLAGWEIVGGVGYSPAFVRGPILGSWGAPPAATRIAYSPATLSALRRAATGQPTAVVLDAAGAAALPTLPFAADLEIVTRSAALPASLLCAVGDRLPARDADRLVDGLRRLHRTPDGAAILKAMRLLRFEPPDEAALAAARRAFDRAAAPAP